MVNGASPLTIRVAGTEPTPTNTRNAVPMTSAASFWVSRGLVHEILLDLTSARLRLRWSTILEHHSTMSNVIWNITLMLSRRHKTAGDRSLAVRERGRDDDPVRGPGVRILTALQGGRRMSLGEIAAAARAPAVHRARDRPHPAGARHGRSRSGTPARYRLGPATLRLGNVYLDTLELRSRVATWAEDLARRTGCAVRTGVLLLDDVVVVHHEPRPDGTRQMPEVGIVIPAHACALGKALLAFDDDAAARVLRR